MKNLIKTKTNTTALKKSHAKSIFPHHSHAKYPKYLPTSKIIKLCKFRLRHRNTMTVGPKNTNYWVMTLRQRYLVAVRNQSFESINATRSRTDKQTYYKK